MWWFSREMSNTEDAPLESPCPRRTEESPQSMLLEPREVPLGGPRAMTVRRTLPHKQIRTVGAWCFVDHYGPDPVSMAVPPHPHIGLQTVSWLLEGQVEHRDSLGSLQRVRPGELNLMSAGYGIAHSEYSVGTGPLHGVQLWVALPDSTRDEQPRFEHHHDLPEVFLGSTRCQVIVGEFAGERSPAGIESALTGVEVAIVEGARLPLRADYEYAVLALDTDIEVGERRVPRGAMQYLGWGADSVPVSGTGRALLLGGEPLAQDLLMWWNFVGRSHDEIERAREQWESGDERFGDVPGDHRPRLPAPALPSVALKPRPPRR